MHNINNEVINNEVDMAYLETSKDSYQIRILSYLQWQRVKRNAFYILYLVKC